MKARRNSPARAVACKLGNAPDTPATYPRGGTLDRRTFIGTVLGLVAAPCTAAAPASSLVPMMAANARGADSNGTSGRNDPLPDTTGPSALLATLSDRAAAGWLGRLYLAEHPHEQDTNGLVDELWNALKAAQGEVPSDGQTLQQALISLIQQEYVSAPMQRVDGWLLAPSEARLYALAAMATSSRQVHLPTDRATEWRTPRPRADC